MIKLKRFLAWKWAWAKQAPYFWFSLALTVLTILIIFYWASPIVNGTPSDFRLRLWAMILQLIGAYTVWHDLIGTARDFNQSGIIRRTISWIKRGISNRTIILTTTGSAQGNSSTSARIRQRTPIDPTLPPEERLTAVENNLQFIDGNIADINKELNQSTRQLETKIKSEASQRKDSIRTIEERMRESATQNLPILQFGAWWVFVGIVLSTLAPEITKVVVGQWAIVRIYL
jgi:hypothetical protein